jgi:hypothetical protein
VRPTQRTCLLLVLPIVLAVIGATAAILTSRHVCSVVAPLSIEPTHLHSDALLLHATADEQGTLYALEMVGQRPHYLAYSPGCRLLWCVEDHANAACNQVIVSFPGSRGEPVGRYSGTADVGWVVGGNVWVHVSACGKVTSRKLDPIPGSAVEFDGAVCSDKGLYLVGMTEEADLVAARFDNSGRRLWVTTGHGKGRYSHMALDADGNLIASYSPTGVGVFFAKYSSEGGLMSFRKAISAHDGASVVWMGVDPDANIRAVLRLHDTIVLRSEREAGAFLSHGSRYVVGTGTGDWDESGRDQDFVLMTLDHNGKPLRKKVLSHGAWLVIEAAARSNSGDVYVVGNRRKVNSYGFPTEPDGAQLIKCDSDGHVIWSRRVALPTGSFVNGVTLDNKGGVYIYGDGRDTPDRKYSGPSRPFIYKIKAE